jgi:hypothetical protein
MNTVGHRRVLVGELEPQYMLFKLPDNLDFEDTGVVQSYYVRYGTLHINYVDGRSETIEHGEIAEADTRPVSLEVQSAEYFYDDDEVVVAAPAPTPALTEVAATPTPTPTTEVAPTPAPTGAGAGAGDSDSEQSGEECDCCTKSWDMSVPNEWGVCSCICSNCGDFCLTAVTPAK